MAAVAPWNFSWVDSGKLAAMASPQTAANIQFLYNEGIRHLVTLSPEMRPLLTHSLFADKSILWSEIAIKEFEPPTLQQIKHFIGICENAHSLNEAVAVHCRMGRGRTGVMAACYLVRFFDQTFESAISNIRLIRPYSIETYQQERSVKNYFDYLRSL